MKSFKFALQIICVCFTLLGSAWALMPPHVRSVVPADKGVLKGNKVLISGYSLNHAKLETLKITDVTSGKIVDYSTDLSCKNEGDCSDESPMGSCQKKCELIITLKSVQKTHTYKRSYLEWVSTFSTE